MACVPLIFERDNVMLTGVIIKIVCWPKMFTVYLNINDQPHEKIVTAFQRFVRCVFCLGRTVQSNVIQRDLTSKCCMGLIHPIGIHPSKVFWSCRTSVIFLFSWSYRKRVLFRQRWKNPNCFQIKSMCTFIFFNLLWTYLRWYM